MMKERKRCEHCKEPLISFKGHYLHPETPCEGNFDSLDVTAKIEDNFLYNKYIEVNGTPKKSDYEMLNDAEEEVKALKKESNSKDQEMQGVREAWEELFYELNESLSTLKNHWAVKIVLHIQEWFKKKEK